MPDQRRNPRRATLTPDRLQRSLWSAADILRGSIDAGDYKIYLFGLLFLKRLSDRFDEEHEALAAAGADPEDPGGHAFFVPPPARWGALQAASTRWGEALNRACAALEEANPRLDGVLAGIDFDDARRLGDARGRDALLARLIQHFTRIPLGNAALSEPDMLGNAYEYLVERFADDAGKKGGEFRTPQRVVDLVVELLDPAEGMRVCDPTCGSGGMLLGCAHHLARRGGDPGTLRLFGQEKNLSTWSICKMNMLLHGRLSDRIERGDTLRHPRLLDAEGHLLRFDRVLANPPFSLDEWGREEAARDPHGRFQYGLPPKAKGDLAFLQHMVATLDAGGQAGVVVPHGVLFRGAAEGEIRRRLVEEDLFDGVVGLPPNLFFGTGIPAAVVVLRREKPPERRGRVIFIDASRDYEEGPVRNLLRDEDVQRIARTYRDFEDVPGYARVARSEEIEASEHSLSIGRYVAAAEAPKAEDVASAIAKLRDLTEARDQADARLYAVLRELGYEA